MTRSADAEDDLLQEEVAASLEEQGPGSSSDAHYTPPRPQISWCSQGRKDPLSYLE